MSCRIRIEIERVRITTGFKAIIKGKKIFVEKIYLVANSYIQATYQLCLHFSLMIVIYCFNIIVSIYNFNALLK